MPGVSAETRMRARRPVRGRSGHLDGRYGLYDQEDLKDAEPDTLRYRLLSLPARLVRHARARVLKISLTWPWKEAFLTCW